MKSKKIEKKNGKKMEKKLSFFFVSAGGLEKRIFSRETLLLRGGRKGDPDTKSGLGKIVIARAARRKNVPC